MTRRLLHALVSLYPPAFRRRYGHELHDLVDELSEREPRRALVSALGLVGGAAREWWQRSRPQAVAALLVPALVLTVGVGLVTRSGGAVPSPRHTTVQGQPRRIPAQRLRGYVVPGGGRTCFVAGCGLNACPVLVAPVLPGKREGKTVVQVTPCAPVDQKRLRPRAVFIDDE
jgi:hypothetical protein